MKKGALRTYVMDKFGPAGFTRNRKIRISVLRKLKASGSAITRRRANFALNFRKRARKGERGSAAVSAAILLIILVLFIIGMGKIGITFADIVHAFKVFFGM